MATNPTTNPTTNPATKEGMTIHRTLLGFVITLTIGGEKTIFPPMPIEGLEEYLPILIEKIGIKEDVRFPFESLRVSEMRPIKRHSFGETEIFDLAPKLPLEDDKISLTEKEEILKKTNCFSNSKPPLWVKFPLHGGMKYLLTYTDDSLEKFSENTMPNFVNFREVL